MKIGTKKTLFGGMAIIGIVLTIISLIMVFSGGKNDLRGVVFLIGICMTIFGIFKFPNVYHTKIVNIVFIFPMVFTFFITVLLPFILGIYYSFTDWNGVEAKNFVGIANYITMFKQMDFVYSFIITSIFTILNMILVNAVAFLLALLCTSKIKGKDFFRAAYLAVCRLYYDDIHNRFTDHTKGCNGSLECGWS